MEREIRDMRIKNFFSHEDPALIDLSVSVVCRENLMRLYWAKDRKADQIVASSNVTSDFFVGSIRRYYEEYPEAHYYVTMNSEINMENASAVYDALVELGADVMIKEEFWHR